MPLLGLPPHVLESILDKLSLVDMIAFKLCSRKSKEVGLTERPSSQETPVVAGGIIGVVQVGFKIETAALGKC